MQASAEIKTPAQYIASLSPARRAAVRAVHDAIRKTAPVLKPTFACIRFGKLEDLNLKVAMELVQKAATCPI